MNHRNEEMSQRDTDKRINKYFVTIKHSFFFYIFKEKKNKNKKIKKN